MGVVLPVIFASVSMLVTSTVSVFNGSSAPLEIDFYDQTTSVLPCETDRLWGLLCGGTSLLVTTDEGRQEITLQYLANAEFTGAFIITDVLCGIIAWDKTTTLGLVERKFQKL